MAIQENSQRPATPAQRFYYVCYLLSMAGFEKYAPGSATSEFFSGIYSFLGFILLTTANSVTIFHFSPAFRQNRIVNISFFRTSEHGGFIGFV